MLTQELDAYIVKNRLGDVFITARRVYVAACGHILAECQIDMVEEDGQPTLFHASVNGDTVARELSHRDALDALYLVMYPLGNVRRKFNTHSVYVV